jgi:UPF0755 protein
MADEPTWDDLFGSNAETAPPVQDPQQTEHGRHQVPPQQAQPTSGAHAAQPDAVQSTPVQPTPVQSTPVQPTPVQSTPVQSTPVRPSAPIRQARPAGQPTEVQLFPPRPTDAPSSRRTISTEPAPPSRRSRPPRRRRSRAWIWILAILVVFGGTGSFVVWNAFGPQIRTVLGLEGATDYTGSGNGQVATVTIIQGQNGSDIAHSLQLAGVTKTSKVFYDLLLKQPTVFSPGTYKLEKQMSAKAALADLVNPANRVISKVVIPEGKTLPQFLAILSKGTGVPLKDFQAAAKNYTALGVPKKAPSLEGFLFPATYQFDPGLPAKTILQRLVNRMYQSLNAAGVKPADRLHVLTLASIVQKEGGSTKDFYKVARVFQNRLDKPMNLESDATVAYGTGSTKIATTKAQRLDASNRYNTYANPGLPIGPIANPGDAAIKAALHPAAGPWFYFTLVNGYTGQTVFSTTLAQHNVAVVKYQTWLAAHPGFDK